MFKAVKKYINAIKDLEDIRNDYSSSFMDISVRIDRVKNAKQKAIQALGEAELEKIIKDK